MSSAAAATPSVLDLAREYVTYELEPNYRKQVQDWLDSNNEAELKTAFVPRIAFGTAGKCVLSLATRLGCFYFQSFPFFIVSHRLLELSFIQSMY